MKNINQFLAENILYREYIPLCPTKNQQGRAWDFYALKFTQLWTPNWLLWDFTVVLHMSYQMEIEKLKA